MRFLHLAPGYAPYKGGMPQAAQMAAEGLAHRGHEVVVVTPVHRDAPVVEEMNGVQVRRIFCWPKTALAGWPWGFGKWWKQDWDAVVLHLPFFGVEEWVALAWWFTYSIGRAGNHTSKPRVSRGAANGFSVRLPVRPRLVVWYHMDAQMKGKAWWMRAIAWVAQHTSVRYLCANADTIFVASHSYARTSWLADQWERVAPRVVVQPFGVDTTRFSPSADGVLNGVQKRIVFVGGMDSAHYFKGVPMLLRALARLRLREDWVLELVGDGELRASYEQLAKDVDIAHRVRFLGRGGDLALFYRGAWVHVLPSIDRSEAFGIVTLEAGASGVPSMVSDLPGMRDALVDGKTGWCVPVGDEVAWSEALERVLNLSAQERAVYGAAARQWVENSASEEAYVDAIEHACKNL